MPRTHNPPLLNPDTLGRLQDGRAKLLKQERDLLSKYFRTKPGDDDRRAALRDDIARVDAALMANYQQMFPHLPPPPARPRPYAPDEELPSEKAAREAAKAAQRLTFGKDRVA